MKPLGIVRKLDNLNRLTIPKELCRSLNMEPGTPLEILADEKGLRIQKHSEGCVYCHSEDKVVVWHGVLICRACASDILAKGVKEGVAG